MRRLDRTLQVPPRGLVLLAPLLAAFSVACLRPEPDEPVPPGSTLDCETQTYPADPVEPMALGEVIAPYRWPRATLRSEDRRVSVDLAEVPCALDDDIDWSPFDVLLFVSIPAW